ncbi:MAG: DUF3990 domain-containing protein [Chitinispirillia bacterium]|nr:DUF3990 domain-containing protein [Chitinispirillia bacterium]
MEFSKINLLKCSPQKDFGTGFYTAISKRQAEKFAKIKSTRYQKNYCLIFPKQKFSLFLYKDKSHERT